MSEFSDRITPKIKPKDGIKFLREAKGYFVTNAARDNSQSDFKNRILPHTDMSVAADRDAAGYFSIETSGGASIHVDMMRKQINPFEKLRMFRKRMPNTLMQIVVRGVNLFGYRPYPENVVRLAVKTLLQYTDVWRVYDFLNHVPNMIPVIEEARRADKYIAPCVCFSTGPEHTDAFYVKKIGEILDVAGKDIILVIKNHSGLGTPSRIYQLTASILQAYPDLVIQYHGHNSDGNDVARIVAAVKAGAKIIDAADHAMTGFFGPPPALTVIQTLAEEGYRAVGINIQAIIEANEKLKNIRPFYAAFESQYKGFDPTVHIHKLAGGALASSLEQAIKGRFLDRMTEIMLDELPRVHNELGNFWSVAPGSQILWTTAVNNVISGKRYETVSEDLKQLLLEKYGPFPFSNPPEEIYRAVLGEDWKKQVVAERGAPYSPQLDLDAERQKFELAISRKSDIEEFALYLLHSRDAVEFFKFEEEYGRVHVLPPEIWYRIGGFAPGEEIAFEDHTGKHHRVSFGPSHETPDGGRLTYLMVNHNPRPFIHKPKQTEK